MFQPVRYVRDHLPDDVDATAAHVALAIAAYTDRRGEAEVGIRTLSTSTRLNPATIVRAVKRLEEWGVIAVDRRDDRRSRYRFPTQETLSTTVLPERTVLANASAETARFAHTPRLTSARALDFSGENKTHTRADGSIWLPGTGWVPAYRGAANA